MWCACTHHLLAKGQNMVCTEHSTIIDRFGLCMQLPCAHVHTHTCRHLHARMCMHVSAHVWVHMYMCMHTRESCYACGLHILAKGQNMVHTEHSRIIDMHMHTHMHVGVCTCTHPSVRVCACAHMHVGICMHTDTWVHVRARRVKQVISLWPHHEHHDCKAIMCSWCGHKWYHDRDDD